MENLKGKMVNIVNIFLLNFFVFLFPLFFIVKTSEFFEFNKQYLLFLFIPFIILSYLFKRLLVNKNIVFHKTPLDIPILTFLIVYFISSILSIDRFSSFFGYYENISNSFFIFLFLWLLYFLLNNLGFARHKHKLLKTLIYSSGVVVIVYLLSYLEVIYKIFPNLSIDFKNTINLLGGSNESFSVFVSILIILVFGYIYYSFKRDNIWVNKYELFYFKFLLFLYLFTLIIVGGNISFIILLIGSFCYLLLEVKLQGFKMMKWKESNLFLFLFIILSVVFLVLINYYSIDREQRSELSLDYGNSYLISYEAIKDNPIIGTGPSTFAYNFSLYRDSSLNYSSNWQRRFDRPTLYLLELLGSSGIAGILAYLLIISILIDLIIIYFYKYFSYQNYFLVVPILIVVIILILLHFIINFSLFLLFLFWFLLSLLISELEDVKIPGFSRDIILVNTKKKYGALLVLLIILLFSWFFFLFMSSKFWMEDYYFKKGDEKSLLKSANLDTDKFSYKIKLSKYYLNKLKTELEKPLSLQNREVIQNSIDNSLKYAQKAKVLQPYSVLTNEALGMVYRDVKYMGEGGSIEAINAFEDAINLEPSNPVLYTELGKEYLYIDLLDKAATSFYKALELKADFHEARFGLAKIFVRQEKYNNAQFILDELSNIYDDPEIFFEKGRLYYNQGEIEKAIDNFQKSISLNPFHYDSLHGLAVIYDAKGDKVLAQEYLEKALKINPNIEISE